MLSWLSGKMLDYNWDSRLCHIWKSGRIMLAVGQIVVCTILKDILMLYSFPMHPSNTPNAKKLGFDPPNGGKRGILPLSFKNLKIPLGCFPVLVCGPDWAQPTWRWALVMIGPWGHPWGVTKGVKRPKMRVLEETHENGQKIMKKNEKLSIFASELLNIVVGRTICTRSWTVGWSGCPWGSQNDQK